MATGESLKVKGHLLNGNNQIPIEAAYATKYSLSLKFLNGYNLSQGFEFEKIVFNIEKEKIEIGPCRFIVDSNNKPYKGYLIFHQNIYDFYSLFYKKTLETLQNEFSNLPLILKHKKAEVKTKWQKNFATRHRKSRKNSRQKSIRLKKSARFLLPAHTLTLHSTARPI